ncbi:hypothetical protein LAG90_15925 [Marinilongibacter aquaticus]|uniref:MarR family winged helix-turn-helix transcriptional regulator n=1 Tax=Marinilongibacter aquaticus TaxID=2975157 RepID=UPI0021BD88D2|nr:hypothetical protein [Marinilongibacter aquaticus]UBM58293.1 hypothetical protein LAG90_15925 [Marinilongibacter aquaticus]
MPSEKLPIGYYLKKVDKLLTESINEIHASEGINRLEWQVLNGLYLKPNQAKNELQELMQPFASPESLEKLLANLSTRELISVSDKLKLSPKGITLHQSCLKKQNDFRQHVMRGIANEDYTLMIKTLEKIIDNIQASE